MLPPMFFGYNTNGLAHHDLFDAVELLAEIGYRGVAITIDHNALPPSRRGILPRPEWQAYHRQQITDCGDCWSGWACDRSSKRRPLPARSADEARADAAFRRPRRRIDFYKYAIDCAAAIGQRLRVALVGRWGLVHFSARRLFCEQTIGRKHGPVPFAEQAMDRLVEGLREVLDYAAARNVAHRFRAGAGNADRLACGRSRSCSAGSMPQLAVDARRGPSPLPRRNADRRNDSPLGAAVGERASRRRAPRRARALDVRRRGDRFPAHLAKL